MHPSLRKGDTFLIRILSEKDIAILTVDLIRADAEVKQYPVQLAYSEFVQMIEKRQGVKISAPEEIAYRHNWIDKAKLMESAERYGKSP